MAGVIAQHGAQVALDALTQAGTTLYVALLTGDPSTSGSGGSFATNVSNLVEVTTGGYARAPVVFTSATASLPSVSANNSTITWGPFTGDMQLSAQWAALVTVLSGTGGSLLYTWTLETPEQAASSQQIQIATGDLEITFT